MINTPKNSSGITILLMVIILLLISTLLILFSAQYSTLQQKISSNLYQSQQAYEAAQAGLEAALPYLKTQYSSIMANTNNGFLLPYINSSTQNVSLANGSSYSFVYSNPTANNFQLITITSTGTSANGNASRIITQQISSYASSIPTPTTSVETQGNITLSSKAALINNQTNTNIIAGNSITYNDSAHSDTSTGITSNATTIGSDVQQHQSSLSSLSNSDFFQLIFGTNSAAVQSIAQYTYTNASDTNYNNSLNGINGSIIWINQTAGSSALINGSATIGTSANPVILVVNGNLQLANNATIYGFIFVFNATLDTLITNNATIYGAIASTNNIIFSGKTILSYNNAVLNLLPAVSINSSNYAKVPASWRDF